MRVGRPFRKVMEISGSLAITLPREVEKKLNLNPGDYVVVSVEEDCLIVRRVDNDRA